MIISTINNQSAPSTSLPLGQTAEPAKKTFFQTPIHLTLALRFFSCKELADVAKTNRVFRSVAKTAVEHEIRAKKMIHFVELCNFAKHLSHSNDVGNFLQASPYLANLTELDFSNWNFDNELFLHLRNLSYERLRTITSLNFTSAQNLTFAKLNSLLVRLPPFSNRGLETENQLDSAALFPSLNSLDFTGSNYTPDTEKLFNVCPWLINGHGTITDPDGEKYEGEWLEGEEHGHGTATYPSGLKYEGEWLEGEKHGHGTLTYPSGEKYEGGWQKGVMHGQGTMTYPDGAKYEGEWLQGKRQGQGTFIFPEGEMYEGGWIEGEEHGQGVLTRLNGSKYDGEWFKGKKHGQGIQTLPDGTKYEGGWREGKPHGQGIQTLPDGTKYEGSWIEGKPHGQGTWTQPDGAKYEGAWMQGIYQG